MRWIGPAFVCLQQCAAFARLASPQTLAPLSQNQMPINMPSRVPAHKLQLLKVRGGSAVPAAVTLKAPPDAYAGAVAIGTKKGQASIFKTLILGIQAGLQLGIGSAMAVVTLAGMSGLQSSNPALAKVIYGAIGLPTGLLMCVTTGSELFTGNTAIVGAAYFEKKISTMQLLKNWIWSYAGNLLGTAALAWLCQYAGVFKLSASQVAAIATSKASLSFGVAFARGVLCNWLVTSSVWLAGACSDYTSKAVAILGIITIFAALGFEHSVANMWISPFSAFNGGPGYVDFFIRNLVPVTLGNIVGGFLIVAGINYLAFGSFDKKQTA